jgi:hypothetical protein
MAHEISMMCRHLGLRRAMEGVIMLTRDGNGFLQSTAIGHDLRCDPLEVRKTTLASVLAKAGPGIRFNEHIEGDGPTVFAHACKLGLEGIVSKRKGSLYRSGRSPDWLKMKNPEASAVKREAEEEWGKRNEGDQQEPNYDLRPKDRRHLCR